MKDIITINGSRKNKSTRDWKSWGGRNGECVKGSSFNGWEESSSSFEFKKETNVKVLQREKGINRREQLITAFSRFGLEFATNSLNFALLNIIEN